MTQFRSKAGSNSAAASDFLSRFGLESAINAASWWTALGGSIMAPEVLEAMVEASKHYVDMALLNRRAGEYVASITGAEAGLVTAGCSAAVVLQAAACLTGPDEMKALRLPQHPPERRQIVIQTAHRNRYDGAYEQAGAELVEVGTASATALWQLEGAINEKTCAVAHVVSNYMRQPLALEDVARVAHQRGVPVIVDAAAQLPPPENLRTFLRQGADLVAFSGGKGLGGPQASGLLCGRKDLIEAATVHSLNLWSPQAGIGRPMKATKESIAGLIRAVELFLARDHEADRRRWRGWAEHIVTHLQGLDGLEARVEEEGRGTPHAVVYFESGWRGPSVQEVVERLLRGSPPIYVNSGGFRGELFMMTANLRDGEDAVVGKRLREALLARA